MKHTTLKIAGMALAIAASALVARADVAINPNVSLYGYAAGFVEYNQYGDGANSSTGMDLRAAKLGAAYNFAPVTAKTSLYYTGGDQKLHLLEANATYDFGDGLSLMGGRFLSKFGYEPFDIPAGFFITNGASPFGDIAPGFALMPNFHEGLRLEYAIDKANTVGISFVDSLYNGANALSGDGKLSDGYGVEAYYRYVDGPLSLGVTVAYQNTRDTSPVWDTTMQNVYLGDIWAQYIINKDTLLAAEFFYKHGTQSNFDNLDQYYGLVTIKQQITDKFSLAGRVSAGSSNYGPNNAHLASDINFWKISVTPAYAVTKNLSIAAEVNYTKTNKKVLGNAKDSQVYAGVQACLSF